MRRGVLALLVAAPLAMGHVILAEHLHWQHSGLDTLGRDTVVTKYTVYCDSEEHASVAVDSYAASADVQLLGLADGEWQCRVTAWNSDGESAPSEPKSFLVGAGAASPAVPAAPYGLTFSEQ